MRCARSVDSRVYRLTAKADYTDSSVTGLRTWTVFRFMVHGGDLDDDHNVNIRLSEYRVPSDLRLRHGRRSALHRLDEGVTNANPTVTPRC